MPISVLVPSLLSIVLPIQLPNRFEEKWQFLIGLEMKYPIRLTSALTKLPIFAITIILGLFSVPAPPAQVQT